LAADILAGLASPLSVLFVGEVFFDAELFFAAMVPSALVKRCCIIFA
jgi:hypothetical protein